MAGERTFVVKFISDTAAAKAGLKLLSGDIKGFGNQVSKTAPLFGAIAVGATAAFGAVAVGLTKAVKAAMEDQASQAELQRQLEKTFGANDALTRSAERYISVTQLRTGTSDTELRASLGTLVRATGDLTQSQQLLTTAQDISAATGKDLATVSIALAKASQGQFTAISRLGIPIDEATKKSKDFKKILGDLNTQFGGAAATSANTFGGQLKILSAQFGEIMETIGSALLPYLQKLSEWLVKNVAPAIQRVTSVIGEKGLIAGFQQLLFESGKAGSGVAGVFKAIAVAAANAVNIIAKAYYLTSANFKLLSRDFIGAGKDFYKATKDYINVDDVAKKFDAIAIPVNNYKLSIRDAINEQSSFQGSVEDMQDPVSKTGKALKQATKDLKDYSAALTGANSAQKSLDSAIKSSKSATKSKLEADTAVIEAQAKFDKISQGYGANSPEAIAAQTALARAQRDQERATFAVEEAIYSVADAEMNLQKVRQDPESSPMDVRRAELALAEAKLTVADATDAQVASTKDLSDQQQILNDTIYGATIGSLVYTEAQDALTQAKERQAEAIDAVTEALEAEAAALEALKLAQQTFFASREFFTGMSASVGMPEFVKPNDPRFIGNNGRVSAQSAPTIIVNSAIADAGLPQLIVDALKTYNKTVGTIPVVTR